MGLRKQVNVRLPVDLIDRIDSARGKGMSRDAWIERAALLALRPTSVIADPEIRQPVHKHSIGRPLRTEMHGSRKLRVYECSGCDLEVVSP